MPGSLVLIQETTVSSGVSSVSLTGIDSTYDVYKVVYNNVQPATDAQKIQIRFTVSGSPDTSSNYDRAIKIFRTSTSFNDQSGTNDSSIESLDQGGTDTEETLQGVNYLFNFNNSSEYSFITIEGTARSSTGELNARQGGGVLTVAQACDGIQYFFASGNIASGTFKLYGLKK